MAKNSNASDGIARARQVVMTGPLGDSLPSPDKNALHNLLERMRDLNLTLISVTAAIYSPRIPIRR